MRIALAPLLVAALVLTAGCSGSKSTSTSAPDAVTTTDGTTDPAVPPTFAPVGITFVDHDCLGVETVVPVPMDAARALMPEGFTVIPFTVFMGAPGLPAGADPEAALGVIGISCGNVTGAFQSDTDSVLFAGIPVLAPDGLAAGNDFVHVASIASSASAPSYAKGGFSVHTGDTIYGLIGIADTVQEASTTSAGGTLAITQNSVGQPGAPGAGFTGRFFAVQDGGITGILDFAVSDGASFGTATGLVQVTQGDLMGQTRLAGIAAPMMAPSITLTVTPGDPRTAPVLQT